MVRTLLLTGTAPDPSGVGGIILDELCRFLPTDALSIVYLPEGDAAARDCVIGDGIPMRTLPTPYRRRPTSRLGRIGRAFGWIGMTIANQRLLRARIADCVRFARERDVGQVWAVLDSPATIELAATVSRMLAVPLKVMVWDDVEHNIGYFGLDRLTAGRVRGQFELAMRSATRTAVIGETMQAAYLERYGQAGVIVRHGVEPPISATVPVGDDAIRIGYAGSVSARSAFDCLLATLDQLNWEIAGRPVTLVLMGGRFDLWSRVPRRIECLGWRSVEDTIRTLSGCTLNYLPQPFEADWRPFSELSFPSKLTAYLAARAPVLLHAPAYASLPRFHAKHAFAEVCTRVDAAALEASLRRVALDPQARALAMAAAATALRDEFSLSRFHGSFGDFLGVDRHAANA
jgi:hypothetical protein